MFSVGSITCKLLFFTQGYTKSFGNTQLYVGACLSCTMIFLLKQNLSCQVGLGCRFKANCPLVEPGLIGGVPSVGRVLSKFIISDICLPVYVVLFNFSWAKNLFT